MAADDYKAIWWPFPESRLLPDSGEEPLTGAEVVALTKDPNPTIRRLACELVAHRWSVCEDQQGGD